ncbi:MAG: outer membrane beta-barrel protein [Mailhella sp.]|nr:outer membrane beta-barrel protein [Mailhella sp.]
MKNIMKGAFCACALVSLFGMTGAASAADQVKESYYPSVNGSPITLYKDNYLTQKLGGRATNFDIWVGEFAKYDSNIFNSKGHKEDDFVFSTAAGFKFETENTGVWKFRIEGQGQHNAYIDHTEFNGGEGYLKADGSIDFSPALTVRAKAGYTYDYDTDVIVNDHVGMHRYNAGAGVTLRPSPFAGMDIDYTFSGQNRDKNRYSYQDLVENGINLRPYWEMTPNTTIYAKLGAFLTTHAKDYYNDSMAYTAALGLSWKYKDTAKAFVEAGVKFMDFDDNGAIARRMTNSTDSVTRPTLLLGGDMALNADWRAGLNFGYAPVVSAMSMIAQMSNYMDRYMTSLFLQYSPGAGRLAAKLTPYWSHNEPNANQSYDEYGAHIGIAYSFTEWFNVSAGYKYSVLDYSRTGSRNRSQLTLGFAATF